MLNEILVCFLPFFFFCFFFCFFFVLLLRSGGCVISVKVCFVAICMSMCNLPWRYLNRRAAMLQCISERRCCSVSLFYSGMFVSFSMFLIFLNSNLLCHYL